MISKLLAWARARLRGSGIRYGDRIVGVVDEVHESPEGIYVTGRITDPTLAELLVGMPDQISIEAPPGGPAPEVSEWAEHIALELASARVDDDVTVINDEVRGILYAATADAQLAYEVLVALSRVVGIALRPAGHAGGPIGTLPAGAEGDPLHLRAAQLVGYAAQGDAAMVDAIARTVIPLVDVTPDQLLEARSTLWSILEVLASEPIRHNPQGDPE